MGRGRGEGGREGGGVINILDRFTNVLLVFSTEIYQQLSPSIQVESSGNLPKRLNLFHIIGVLEI